jgi:hypothetical protein
MRRAVNYAIDRRALVQHHLLFNGGRATDHYLVPGIPGSGPLDIYPLGGPDLAKARQLAGGVRAHATLYVPTGAPQFMDDAQIVRRISRRSESLSRPSRCRAANISPG